MFVQPIVITIILLEYFDAANIPLYECEGRILDDERNNYFVCIINVRCEEL